FGLRPKAHERPNTNARHCPRNPSGSLFQRLPLATNVDDYDALLPWKMPADLRRSASLPHLKRSTDYSEGRRQRIAYEQILGTRPGVH
ncbi:hypothetical protein, partial [Burkholderia sp. ABCPW 11]|uniref:hypothetical protein n=1 Tax=Burkholderia sp. ABCPW 11 TaxID=1637859 RepID=UPI0012FD01FD